MAPRARLFDAAVVLEVPPQEAVIWSVCLGADGARLWVGRADGFVEEHRLVRSEDGEARTLSLSARKLTFKSSAVVGLVAAHGARALAALSADGSVRVLDAETLSSSSVTVRGAASAIAARELGGDAREGGGAGAPAGPAGPTGADEGGHGDAEAGHLVLVAGDADAGARPRAPGLSPGQAARRGGRRPAEAPPGAPGSLLAIASQTLLRTSRVLVLRLRPSAERGRPPETAEVTAFDLGPLSRPRTKGGGGGESGAAMLDIAASLQAASIAASQPPPSSMSWVTDPRAGRSVLIASSGLSYAAIDVAAGSVRPLLSLDEGLAYGAVLTCPVPALGAAALALGPLALLVDAQGEPVRDGTLPLGAAPPARALAAAGPALLVASEDGVRCFDLGGAGDAGRAGGRAASAGGDPGQPPSGQFMPLRLLAGGGGWQAGGGDDDEGDDGGRGGASDDAWWGGQRGGGDDARARGGRGPGPRGAPPPPVRTSTLPAARTISASASRDGRAAVFAGPRRLAVFTWASAEEAARDCLLANEPSAALEAARQGGGGTAWALEVAAEAARLAVLRGEWAVALDALDDVPAGRFDPGSLRALWPELEGGERTGPREAAWEALDWGDVEPAAEGATEHGGDDAWEATRPGGRAAAVAAAASPAAPCSATPPSRPSSLPPPPPPPPFPGVEPFPPLDDILFENLPGEGGEAAFDQAALTARRLAAAHFAIAYLFRARAAMPEEVAVGTLGGDHPSPSGGRPTPSSRGRGPETHQRLAPADGADGADVHPFPSPATLLDELLFSLLVETGSAEQAGALAGAPHAARPRLLAARLASAGWPAAAGTALASAGLDREALAVWRAALAAASTAKELARDKRDGAASGPGHGSARLSPEDESVAASGVVAILSDPLRSGPAEALSSLSWLVRLSPTSVLDVLTRRADLGGTRSVLARLPRGSEVAWRFLEIKTGTDRGERGEREADREAGEGAASHAPAPDEAPALLSELVRQLVAAVTLGDPGILREGVGRRRLDSRLLDARAARFPVPRSEVRGVGWREGGRGRGRGKRPGARTSAGTSPPAGPATAVPLDCPRPPPSPPRDEGAATCLRLRLQRHLEEDEGLDPSEALEALAGSTLDDERVLLLARLGRHAAALDILAGKLRDLPAACGYAARHLGASAGVSAVLGAVLGDGPGGARRASVSTFEDALEVLGLFSASAPAPGPFGGPAGAGGAIGPPVRDAAPPVRNAAPPVPEPLARALSRGALLALEAAPDTAPLRVVAPSLGALLLRGQAAQRALRAQASLLSSLLSRERAELAELESRRVLVDEDALCGRCGLRLGRKVFVVLPEGRAEHGRDAQHHPEAAPGASSRSGPEADADAPGTPRALERGLDEAGDQARARRRPGPGGDGRVVEPSRVVCYACLSEGERSAAPIGG